MGENSFIRNILVLVVSLRQLINGNVLSAKWSNNHYIIVRNVIVLF